MPFLKGLANPGAILIRGFAKPFLLGFIEWQYCSLVVGAELRTPITVKTTEPTLKPYAISSCHCFFPHFTCLFK